MFKEITAVFSANNTNHINTLNVVRFLSAKGGGTYRYHWALKGAIVLNFKVNS